jgi:hypothetical protein
MSKLLLLVQTEADASRLDAAAKSILASAITGVWLVFSPAITVNASEAATKLDAEIETLKLAERQAADRSDYTAAAGYKTQREGKELDRAKALRDAWKTAPAEERQARIKSIFGPFGEALKAKGLSVRITGHSDHYDREQWVAMLNSLSGVWFKEFTAGGFVVGWPEAMETSIKTVFPERLGLTTLDHERMAGRNTSLTPAEEKEIKAVVPKTRREELASMKYFTLVGAAKKAGVDPAGKKGPQIIEEILDRESKPTTEAAPVPELAEY